MSRFDENTHHAARAQHNTIRGDVLCLRRFRRVRVVEEMSWCRVKNAKSTFVKGRLGVHVAEKIRSTYIDIKRRICFSFRFSLRKRRFTDVQNWNSDERFFFLRLYTSNNGVRPRTGDASVTNNDFFFPVHIIIYIEYCFIFILPPPFFPLPSTLSPSLCLACPRRLIYWIFSSIFFFFNFIYYNVCFFPPGRRHRSGVCTYIIHIIYITFGAPRGRAGNGHIGPDDRASRHHCRRRHKTLIHRRRRRRRRLRSPRGI